MMKHTRIDEDFVVFGFQVIKLVESKLATILTNWNQRLFILRGTL